MNNYAIGGSYLKGQTVTLTGAFTAVPSGLPQDPATVTLRLMPPGSAKQAHVYGLDGALIKVSTGNYSYTTVLGTVGTWRYRWEGSDGNGNVTHVLEVVVTVTQGMF